MKIYQISQLMHQRLDARYGRGEVEAIARMVMQEVLNYSTVDTVLRAQNDAPGFFDDKLENIITRLERDEPIQYILGVATFHGHRFAVTPDTLIPRPETEQLVDMIVDQNGDRGDLRVLDVGTGSGCIAISLARALKFAHVTAIDVSDGALRVAQENARALKARVDFVQADVLAMAPWQPQSLDIVVSNPPYVCQSERAQMQANVLDYEPATALFVPDDDPLRFYRAIARQAAVALAPGGRLYLEVNRRFAADVAALLTRQDLAEASVHRDAFGNDRFVTAQKVAN